MKSFGLLSIGADQRAGRETPLMAYHYMQKLFFPAFASMPIQQLYYFIKTEAVLGDATEKHHLLNFKNCPHERKYKSKIENRQNAGYPQTGDI